MAAKSIYRPQPMGARHPSHGSLRAAELGGPNRELLAPPLSGGVLSCVAFGLPGHPPNGDFPLLHP